MKLQTNIYALNCVVLLSSIFRSSGAMSEVFIFNLQSVNVCDIVNCGKGTCQETTSSLFGFDCDCNSGWTKFQLGSLTFPPCVVPNCTLSSDCGTGSPSPPTLPQPEFNLTDACSYTWCGDGRCKTNGNSYECDCSADSHNFLNATALPCFKECSLGADCHRGFSTPSSSSSAGLRGVKVWTLLILGALFLPLI
ncbi:hypothetical protein V6N11_062337 [Hibiscus sabdariffa]|uniref:EGF-like domain-containing protein n=1 Tax=Hibiscus sabdariffa TaxID=183260 RepID=A0ABR2PSF8_9ROSI